MTIASVRRVPGMPQLHGRVPLVRLAAGVAHQLELHAPRGQEVLPALPGRRVAARDRPHEQPDPPGPQVFDGRVHVVDVQGDVVAAYVAVARLRSLAVVRLVLEDLEVQPEAAAVEPDLPDHPAGVDVDVLEHPVIIVVPHLGQRVDVVAAEYAGKERVRLLHVGHGDSDVVTAAQPRNASAHQPSLSCGYVSIYSERTLLSLASSRDLSLLWIH